MKISRNRKLQLLVFFVTANLLGVTYYRNRRQVDWHILRFRLLAKYAQDEKTPEDRFIRDIVVGRINGETTLEEIIEWHPGCRHTHTPNYDVLEWMEKDMLYIHGPPGTIVCKGGKARYAIVNKAAYRGAVYSFIDLISFEEADHAVGEKNAVLHEKYLGEILGHRALGGVAGLCHWWPDE